MSTAMVASSMVIYALENLHSLSKYIANSMVAGMCSLLVHVCSDVARNFKNEILAMYDHSYGSIKYG
jgi:hypothetical protein